MAQSNNLSGMRPGDVLWGPQSGAILLARAGVVGMDKLAASESVLREATAAETPEVIHLSHPVGIVTNLGWSDAHCGLVAYFRWSGPPIPIRASEVVATGIYAARGVICPSCLSTFQSNSLPCECLYRAETILLGKMHVLGVTFWHGRHDDILRADNRRAILAKHFGGAVASLDFTSQF